MVIERKDTNAINGFDLHQEVSNGADMIFKDHVAEFSDLEEGMQMLKWGIPGRYVHRIDYLIHGNILFVTGDYGSATYRWGDRINFEFLSGLNLGYFAEKCEASEKGRFFKSWDERVAEYELIRWVDDASGYEDLSTDEEVAEERTWRGLVVFGSNEYRYALASGEERIIPFKSAIESCYRDSEWSMWLNEHGYDVFGQDFWEYWPSIGEIVDPRCTYHLRGINRAWKSYKAAKVEFDAT